MAYSTANVSLQHDDGGSCTAPFRLVWQWICDKLRLSLLRVGTLLVELGQDKLETTVSAAPQPVPLTLSRRQSSKHVLEVALASRKHTEDIRHDEALTEAEKLSDLRASLREYHAAADAAQSAILALAKKATATARSGYLRTLSELIGPVPPRDWYEPPH